jgi:hypothetical protein
MSKPHFLKIARRIACFLDTIGPCPILTLKTSRDRYRTLMMRYSALPKELRREARRRGRRVIKTVGLKEATRELLFQLAITGSWGFVIPDGGDEWTTMPDGTLLRTISTATIFEGSILVSPAAYPNTSASLRSLPKSLRSKLKSKRDAVDDDNDCDDSDKDDDGNCPDEEDRSDCDCECDSCEKDGDCSQCSDESCSDDSCQECPAMRQRNAHLKLLKRRLR